MTDMRTPRHGRQPATATRPWDDGLRPPAPAMPTRSVDFFGTRLDAPLVPLAIAIRSTAIDEGRDGDLRRANAFRSTEGRAGWQVKVYEAAFQAASMGLLSALDDARLADLERLYPDPEAVTMARAAGDATDPHADDLAVDVGGPGPGEAPAPTLVAAQALPAAGWAPLALGTEPAAGPALSPAEAVEAGALHASVAAGLATLRARARAGRIRAGILAALRPLVSGMLGEGFGEDEILAAMADAGFEASPSDLPPVTPA